MGNRANKALLRSCEDGDYHSILSLLKRGANVEYTDSYGDTPLLTAIKNQHTNCVDLLLNNEYSCVNTEHRDRTLNTPLMVAVGNLDIVTSLINNRCQLNKTNRFKESALHLAVRIGNIEVVKLLVSSCIDVTLTNKKGQIALTIATNINNKAIAKILSAEAILLEHFTPMDIFLHKILDGKNDSQVDILMKRYRSPNPDDITYKILLQCAVKYRNLLLIKILFKHRIHFDAAVLDIAYEYGDTGFVDFLIQTGLADNMDEGRRLRMISCAVKYGDLKSIKILFKHDIPFEASVLDIAYEHGDSGYVDFLIQTGLADNMDEGRRLRMISCAVKYGDLKSIKILFEHDIPFDASLLDIAYEKGDTGCVAFLIQKGLADNIDEGSRPHMMYYAVKYCDLKTIKMLVEHGIPFDASVLLDIAVKHRDLKTIKILVEHGIPFDASVLDIAYEHGDTTYVDFLIQKGLEDNIDQNNITPMIKKNAVKDNIKQRSRPRMIDYAMKYHDLKTIKILVEHGIPFDASVLDIAYEHGDSGYVDFLIQTGLADNMDEGRRLRMISCAVKYGDLKSIKILFKHDIPFDASLLDIAYEKGDTGCVEFLIQKGLADNIDEGSRPHMMYYAVKYRDLKTIKILVEHGIPFDASVLDIAYEHGDTGCVDFLIQKGLEDNIDRRSGKPIISYCAKHSDHAWVKKLLKHKSYTHVRNRLEPFANPNNSFIITETVCAYFNINSHTSMAHECFFNPGLCAES
ncbi:hypothetical protein SNE40_006803 [Patella caerulea]|uniref:Ankyrin repeat protein n=1 Tax=Patella caerulea TaxID=87958 RepID=A0AAN8Q6T7_PATCE